MTSSISVRRTTNEVPSVEITLGQEHFNEQLLRSVNEVYSPALKLMKLCGAYVGDTSLKSVANVNTSRCKMQFYLQSIYCGLLASGYWFNFVMAFTGIFSGNKAYALTMLSFWGLLIALNATVCLSVLPLTFRRKSRFEQFLLKIITITENVDLDRVKLLSRRGLVMFYFLYTASAAFASIAIFKLDLTVTTVKPWDKWSGLVIFCVIIEIIGTGVWLLPNLFFCSTCLILEELFNNLQRRISSLHSNSIDLATFKMEYHKLCDVVEFADKLLAPLLLGMVSVYIPTLCFNFYNVVNLPEESTVTALINNLFWLLVGFVMLAIILRFGSKVSEKVCQLKIYLKFILMHLLNLLNSTQ